MNKWVGKVAIVSGASAGIGAAIVRDLVHHGMIVVGLARREERVKKLAGELAAAKEPGKLHARKVDLRKEEDILETFAWVDKELGGADVLVNNAGVVGSLDNLIDGKTEDWRGTYETNVLSVTIATREFLKSMERRNNQKGHIIIISSVAGHLAQDLSLSAYVGSKHAIRAISQCLRRELAEKNSTIKVTSVSPGITASELLDGKASVEEAVSKLPQLQPSDVAQVVVNALSTSDVCEICEVVLNPVPTKMALY